jgi:hypothetical protein
MGLLRWGEFVVKQIQELVDLVHSERWLALLEVTDEAKADTRLHGEVFLGESILLAQVLYDR